MIVRVIFIHDEPNFALGVVRGCVVEHDAAHQVLGGNPSCKLCEIHHSGSIGITQPLGPVHFAKRSVKESDVGADVDYQRPCRYVSLEFCNRARLKQWLVGTVE